MATLSGVWIFNETLTSIEKNDHHEYINFINQEKSYISFGLNYNGGIVRYNISDLDEYDLVYDEFWLSDSYRTVDFGPTKQIVSEEFYIWFTANAEEMFPTATISYDGKIIAYLMDNQIVTLKCMGKGMKDDVVVTFLRNINVQGKMFIETLGQALPEAKTSTPVQLEIAINKSAIAQPYSSMQAHLGSSAIKLTSSSFAASNANVENVWGKLEIKTKINASALDGKIEYIYGNIPIILTLSAKSESAKTQLSFGKESWYIKISGHAQQIELKEALCHLNTEGTGDLIGFECQETIKSYFNTFGELKTNAFALVKSLFDVQFSVNGTIEYETKVIENESPEDPVKTGKILKPEKESTAQYHFHYAGWSKTEDGEVVGGGSGETVILEETTYEGFVDGWLAIDPAPFALIEGKTYQVIWDGTEHACVCYMEDDGMRIVTDLVFDENGEPTSGTFAIFYASPELTEAESGGIVLAAYDFSAEDFMDTVNASHTVAIKELSEIEILPKTTYSDFVYNIEFGRYVQYDYSSSFVPVVGETYTVVWDGEAFTCTAQDGNSIVEGATFIGNAAAFGLSGNKEPFIIGGTPDSPMNIVALNDTEATEHTVAIYQQSEPGSEGLPVITEDTTFYAVYDKELRYYTASFYVNDELQSTQTVAYGETATPPEITGMVIQWSTEDFTITGDTDFYGVWVKDYILSGEFTFTYNENYHAYFSSASAKQQLSVGGIYVVEWGDKIFSCVARDISGFVSSASETMNVTLRNAIGSAHNVPYAFNLPATWDDSQSNNEPFCIQTYSQGSNIKANIFTTENIGTTTVNIYAIQ